MRRTCHRIAMLVALGAAIVARAGEAADAASLRSRIEAAIEAEDYDLAARLARDLFRAPDADAQGRGMAYLARGLQLAARKEYRAARILMGRAADALPEPVDVLGMRANLAFRTGDFAGAAEDVERLVALDPGFLEQQSGEPIYRIWRALRKKGGAPLYRFLQTLLDAGFDGGRGHGAIDWMWLDLTRLHAQAGRSEDARAALDRIFDPKAILEAMIDRRYADLWPILDGRGIADAESLYRRDLDYAKERLAAHPKSLAVLYQYFGALRQAEEFTAARHVAQDYFRHSGEYDAEDALERRRISLAFLEGMAAIARAEGRWDEALDLMRSLAGLSADAFPSLVNQKIDLAIYLLEARRYEEALAAAARINPDRARKYGNFFIRMVEACSHAFLGDDEAAGAAAAPVLAEPTANPGAAELIALCLDDAEEVVRVFLVLLDDPDSRSDALLTLALHQPEDDGIALLVALRRRLDAIRDDPRLVAARRHYGRELPFPLPGTGL